MGLFQKVRNGEFRGYKDNLLAEVAAALERNPWYRTQMRFLAGDVASACELAALGLEVAHVFSDAPAHVRHDTTYRMKAWMIQWASERYGNVVWVDWDTVGALDRDGSFEHFCLEGGTPRFVRIPRYQQAKVNCSVVYVPEGMGRRLRDALETHHEIWNDEHLWAKILGDQELDRSAYWFGDYALHIDKPEKAGLITSLTRFVHLGDGSCATVNAVVQALDRSRHETISES